MHFPCACLPACLPTCLPVHLTRPAPPSRGAQVAKGQVAAAVDGVVGTVHFLEQEEDDGNASAATIARYVRRRPRLYACAMPAGCMQYVCNHLPAARACMRTHRTDHSVICTHRLDKELGLVMALAETVQALDARIAASPVYVAKARRPALPCVVPFRVCGMAGIGCLVCPQQMPLSCIGYRMPRESVYA